jgi:uncharacterized protein YsxB (DUF464 family)
MIKFRASTGADGGITAFTVENHGRSDVCAAVSMFVLNTVNSIEALTDEAFRCDYKEEGGYISFAVAEPPAGRECRLLLDAMMLGLNGIKEEYPSEIEIKELK